ncbi:MAG: peptidoglycan DD-metalloendopeptidase family protein [Candidatus Aenigmarchaeota archaeon]|nr:peptidoglycan DD-metalloendopeptidase family protein [Candidatus Aenigmarchaeota archaeon]
MAIIAIFAVSLLASTSFAANFVAGDVVKVTGSGSGMAVRTSYSTSAPLVDGNLRKYQGDRGYVIGGPQFSPGYLWWKIRWGDGKEGWSVDGKEDEVWLTKVSITPSTEFSLNDRVRASNLGGSKLVIRSDPPDLADSGKRVNEGTEGTVVGGPVYGVPKGKSGFYHFWKVDFGTAVGWAAENYLVKSVPDQRPKGIDVSHLQGTIDWTKVKNSGIQFAFVKASQRNNYRDPNFETNMANAKSAGIFAGAYHFACPVEDDELYCYRAYTAKEEAENFVNAAGNYIKEGYLRPALDLEVGASLGKTALSNWVNEFMSIVKEKTGVEPIIYVNSNYANNYLDGTVSKYSLWIAHWTYDTSKSPNTGIWSTWDFWQYSEKGTNPGISGNVDLDIFNGDLNRLNAFVISSAPEPPSPPQNLAAAEGDGRVDLSWSPPSNDGGASITAYKIYKGTTSGGESFFKQVGNVLSYADTAVTNGITYYYKVSAVNSVGEGSLSNEDNATPHASSTVNPPTLKSPEDGSVVTTKTPAFTWTSDSNADYHALYIEQQGADGVWGLLYSSEYDGPIYGDSFQLPSGFLLDGGYYRWQMRSNNDGLWSGTTSFWYFMVSVSPVIPPSAPRNLQAAEGDSRVDLSWDLPADDGGNPIALYFIYRGTDPNQYIPPLSGGVIDGSVRTYTDTAVTNGVTYYYQVSAVTSPGRNLEGPRSSIVEATPQVPCPSGSSSILSLFATVAEASSCPLPPPNPPQLTGPDDGDVLQTTAPAFTWNPDPIAEYHHLFIRNTDTNELVFDSEARGIQITGSSYTLPNGILYGGFNYRWNMKSYNSAGASGISETRKFHLAYLGTATDGFDYPVGTLDSAGRRTVTSARGDDQWYVCQDFRENTDDSCRVTAPKPSGTHLGEDWNHENGGDYEYDNREKVYASANGKVLYTDDAGPGWGNIIIIVHRLPDGQEVRTFYSHLRYGSLRVIKGDIVNRGQEIAEVGKGYNDAEYPAHLHFELNINAWMTLIDWRGEYGYGDSNTDYTSWTDPSNFIDANRPAIHDVSVDSFSISPNPIRRGRTAYAYVTVSNKGTASETFTIEVKDDTQGIVLGTSQQTLSPGSSRAVRISISGTKTRQLSAGSHTMTARVPPVAGETVTANNKKIISIGVR